MSEMDKLRQMAQEHHDLKKLCRKQNARIDELEDACANWLDRELKAIERGNRLDDEVKRGVQLWRVKDNKVKELQARIDALMLEFCPDDMTNEQLSNWATNQARV